ncbi:MAG: EAL domain-containing protein [Alteraurantiacibacter sp.]
MKRLERVRHVAWSGLIALMLLLPVVLDPIDQISWIAEARLAQKPASGEIVFVGADTDLSNPQTPQARMQLATLLTRLEAASVKEVYVNIVFDQPSDLEVDRALNAALTSFSGGAFLVRDLYTGLNGKNTLREHVPVIASDVPEVASDAWRNYLDYVWYMDYAVAELDETLPNMPAKIAGVSGAAGEQFAINYGYDFATIPTYRFRQLLDNPRQLAGLAGKTIIIGPTAAQDRLSPNIPGRTAVPNSIVSIYAAETLLHGEIRYISGFLSLLIAVAALLVSSAIGNRRLRNFVYGATSLLVCVSPVIAPSLGLRLSIAYAGAALLIYALFRIRAQWTRNLLLVDPETSLPTFAALEVDKDVAQDIPSVIVARIHRFEEVRRTLPVELHADYLLAITARLKAATQDATIYLGQGHLIAWTMPEKDPALLREHLEGLRALFASPLIVGEEQVDVSITFGIDITPSPNVARRLAGAIAVAERTTETFDPIAIADITSQEDLIWNISLQARIDAALSNGEIYLAFQPKIMVQTGEIVGAEALVRWKDPVKGQIPPDFFIRQCETAGRMSHLTKFVLEQACKAGNDFEDAGLHLPIAVNISATLLHERSIVKMVSDVLEHSGFDPRCLTLEITETYRISNLDLAAEILEELSALGTKISMDDFGVGAASLEALLRLPFSELKIDRLFIAPMTSDPKALGIVKSILQLGQDLRIIVVAEGVEDEGTLTLLRESGCIVAQGFAIAKPEKFAQILEYHKETDSHSFKSMV